MKIFSSNLIDSICDNQTQGNNSQKIANTSYVDTGLAGKISNYNSQSANNFLAAPNGTPGVPTFRAIVAADIPTLNQNTTGSAAKWTTARNIAGNIVDGSVDVPFANKFIVQGTVDTGLSGAQFLGALASGLIKNTATTGVLSIAASSDIINTLGYTPLNTAGGTMLGFLTLNADPTNAFHAATKQYVDGLITGVTWKNAVVAATTANITLSGLQIIDGILLANGQRVLVKNQTAASQNGIYVAGAGAWTRAADVDTGTELLACAVYVGSGGTVNGGTQWANSNSSTIIIGTTNITFSQIAGAGVYAAGTGISLSGNSFSLAANYGDILNPYGSKSANNFLAAPNGAPGVPTFRAIVAADIPALNYEVPLTFSTGLTRSVNTITVNTSQNISRLSNLTNNGFVKTSGGNGTLTIDTSTYLTENQAITLSGDITGSGTTAITTTIGANKVTDAMLRQSSGVSVIGRSNSTMGNVADIIASLDFTVLRRSGSNITFGPINLASSNAVSGTLANANTTATSANTASAIVARDASGNFSANQITATTFVGALSGNATSASSAATLTTARNLWGRSFNGSADVSGSLALVGDITGGANSMIITAGTGASRTLTLRTTTSGSVATTALTIDDNQNVGIGIAAPQTKLHIYENSASTTAYGLTIENIGSGDAGLKIKADSQTYHLAIDNSDLVNPLFCGIGDTPGINPIWTSNSSGQMNITKINREQGYLSYFSRGFVNFDGLTADNLSGTYSRSGTTVTVTVTGHLLEVGNKVYCDFTSGSATDGLFTVASVINSNTFTFTHGTSGTTSGNVTLNFRQIRYATPNITRVTYSGTGAYVINVFESLADANICAVPAIQANSSNVIAYIDGPDAGPSALTNNTIPIGVRGTGGSRGDYSVITCTIFR